jgi:molybdopterin-guanine dinucleotide biosynthesis protein A
MKQMLTGVVLAGGRSERLGQPKPLLMLGGKLMLARIADALKPVCRELILVVRPGQDDDTPDAGLALGMHVVEDASGVAGPLAGICAGLAATGTPLAFVCGADYPFLSRRLVATMAALSVSGTPGMPRAVVPRAGERLHPLHALYPPAEWRPRFERAAADGENSPRRIVEAAIETGQPPVEVMTADEIEEHDPQSLSLFDIDTPDELARARRVVSLWGPLLRPDIRPGGL